VIGFTSFGIAMNVLLAFLSLTIPALAGHRAAIDSHLSAGVT